MSPDDRIDELPGLAEIERARERIAAEICFTPLLSSRTLGERANASVWLKCENLQRAGSFKFRGAMNACLAARERDELSPAGVVTYSSGNHGQALALAARRLGLRATIVVPEDIPEVKRAAIEGYGARVVACGLTSSERHERASEIAEESGARIVAPFDDFDIIAGQGTTALEILEELPEVDTILVPVGGGGLLSGVAIASAHRNAATRVISIEPADANAMQLSLEAGGVVALKRPPRTIADGLRPMAPGHLTFLAARQHVASTVVVTDESIIQAQEILLERAKLLVEPSGAAAVAALLEDRERFAGQRIVAILTGGNTRPPRFIRAEDENRP